MSGGQCALRLIPSSSTPSSCFLVSYLVTRACGFVASSVRQLAVGLSVVLVHDVSPCGSDAIHLRQDCVCLAVSRGVFELCARFSSATMSGWRRMWGCWQL